MERLDVEDILQYVEQNIGVFHRRRIQSLDGLKLSQVLERKNPYLFKAKYILAAEQLVGGLVSAHISSNEETIFGDWLEGLAIFINNKVYGGRKSSARGIDLEFDDSKARNIVAIKSGPNWGNSSQVAKMIADLKAAKKILKTSNSQLSVVAVNGCCYGRDNRPDKGDYFKYCGQRFWEFISGNNSLFIEIIKPLEHRAKEKNDDFAEAYSRMLSRFTKEFSSTFCEVSGEVDWNKLVQFNSAAARPKG